MKQFRPMKGDGIEIDHATPPDEAIKIMSALEFPRLTSPKLDGIRAVAKSGQLLSSTLELIPNKHLQKKFKKWGSYDGELLLNQPTMEKIYRKTSSAVMSEEGEPDVTFWVFDYWSNPATGYGLRYEHLQKDFEKREIMSDAGVRLLRHDMIKNAKELFEYEQFMLSLDYEGVMTRSLGGIYKYGRSTLREGYLVKIKRFKQEEAEVVDFVEKMTNKNVQTRDQRGLAKRSHAKAGKVPAGTLGALVVKSDKYPKPFEIGSGLTHAEAQMIWNKRDKYLGKLVTFKFFEIGDYDVPRHPVFIGWRDRRTL